MPHPVRLNPKGLSKEFKSQEKCRPSKKETVESPESKNESVELAQAASAKKLPKETKCEENGGPSNENKTIHFQKSCDQNTLEDEKQSVTSETRGNNETRHQRLDKSKYDEMADGVNMANEGDKQFIHGSDEEDKGEHHKYKNHETERNHDLREDISEMYTHEKRKKNKKKKHKKHKHKDEERCSNSDIDEEGAKTHSTKKRKHWYERDSTEFVWVEKTKESLESGDHSARKKDKQDKNSNGRQTDVNNGREVEVKVWDKVSKSNYTEKQDRKCDNNDRSCERRKNYNDEKCRRFSDGDKSRPWSGSRSNSNVVNELKGNSIFGYGENVRSWEGGPSAFDQEVEKEKMLQRKCRLEDYNKYDDELDAGRTKKVKHREDFGSNRYGHENLFQRFQDDRNYGRNRWHLHSSGGGNGYYNKDRHDRGYKKDKYRSYSDHRPRHHSHRGQW